MAAVAAFATVGDYAARYGDPADEGRVALLLGDASAMLLSEYEAYWGDEYAEGAHEAFDRSACAVACKLAHGALSAPAGFEGATQYSQGAGGYTASVTFGGALGHMWLGKADRALLGLSGQRMRVLLPAERGGAA